MEFLSNLGVSFADFVLIIIALGLAIFVVAISQVYWIRRTVISSFISLALVNIMPDKFVDLKPEMGLIYFLIFTVLIMIFCNNKLFEAAYWEGDRLDFGMIIFAFSVLIFFVAIAFHFLDYDYFAKVFTEEFYDFFRKNFFVIALIPVILGMIFGERE